MSNLSYQATAMKDQPMKKITLSLQGVVILTTILCQVNAWAFKLWQRIKLRDGQ